MHGACHDIVHTEVAAEDRESLREGLGQWLEHGKSNDSTEKRCTEGPACLQAKVNVGGSDQGTADTAKEDSADGEDAAAFLGKIVEWHERVCLEEVRLVVVGIHSFSIVRDGILCVVFALHGGRARVAAHIRRGVENIFLLGKGRYCWVDVALESVSLMRLAVLVRAARIERSMMNVVV